MKSQKNNTKLKLRRQPGISANTINKKLSKNGSHTGKTKIKNKLFPVVAIGASAGGLEAYTGLIKNLREDTGMAFVIIQHMDPVHKSFLNEIISRETKLKVNLVENGMKPEPDNIYIIRPNTDLVFEKGKFRTVPRPPHHKPHLPIDIFMRSLVEDHSHYPIGVLLSGTDSDE